MTAAARRRRIRLRNLAGPWLAIAGVVLAAIGVLAGDGRFW